MRVKVSELGAHRRHRRHLSDAPTLRRRRTTGMARVARRAGVGGEQLTGCNLDVAQLRTLGLHGGARVVRRSEQCLRMQLQPLLRLARCGRRRLSPCLPLCEPFCDLLLRRRRLPLHRRERLPCRGRVGLEPFSGRGCVVQQQLETACGLAARRRRAEGPLVRVG